MTVSLLFFSPPELRTSADKSGPSCAPGSFCEQLVWILSDSLKGLEQLRCRLFFHFFPALADLTRQDVVLCCLLQLNLNDMVFGKWKRAYLHIEWTDRITSGHWRTRLMPGNVRPLTMRSHGADFKSGWKPFQKNNNNNNKNQKSLLECSE